MYRHDQTLYISGGMSGLPDNNYPAFHAKELELINIGYAVVNPATIPHPAVDMNGGIDLAKANAYTYFELLSRDFEAIVQDCTGIYMMDGWENSRGACGELSLARLLGLREIYETRPPKYILENPAPNQIKGK